MKNYYYQKAPEVFEQRSFAHYLNLVLLIVDFAVGILGFTAGGPLPIAFHLVLMIPSMIYQFNPNVIKSAAFRWFAHTMISLIMGLSVIVFIMMLMAEGYGALGLAVLFFFVGLPASIVSASLLWVLSEVEQEQQRQQVFMMNEDGQLLPVRV